ERDAVIKALEEGQEMDAKVVYLQTFGAYLEIDGTQVVLRNTDFAQDHTRVIDNHKVNDIIKVKISKISNTKKIFVQAVEKFCADTVMDFSKFNRGDIVFGTIKNIKSTHCYVCIAPDLDALTSVPEVFTVEPTEGMRVVIRITKIIEEEKRVRGKIISFIEETNDFNL
ncbi:MAG: S1 RNA-binding domain-containing protein, partial [Peptostreptococcaceae bacterium]